MQPLEADEPTTVGPYRLLGRLGSGGMGRVYLGRSAGGRTVAVKIVHPHFALDEEFRARFRREVQAARRVGGAWTAPVLDADPDARVPWVATAYAAGPSLTAAVTDGGPLPAHSVRALGAGLGEALAAVHDLGLVHRDVKPSNVLLTLDGPLLIDFGIARATDGTASLTSTGVSIGSPATCPRADPRQGRHGRGGRLLPGRGPRVRGHGRAALPRRLLGRAPLQGRPRGAAARHPRRAAAGSGRRLPGQGPVRPSGPRRGGPAPRPRGRGPPDLWRLAAGSAGGTGQPERRAAAEPGGGGGGARVVVGAGVGPGGLQPAVGHGRGGRRGWRGGARCLRPPPVMPPPTAPAADVPAPREGDHAPGRLSVSVAATSTQAGAGGRGRRLSCTVALAVAGAMAAVTVGSVFVLDLLPGEGGKTTPGGSDTATHSPADPVAVPERYVGTWEGQAVAVEGNLPLGTFRLTVREAAVGEKLGTLRHTDIFGGTCDDVLTLKKVTQKEIVTGAVGAEGNRDVCNQALHTVRLTPVGDDLQYASDSEDSGRPKARLSKVE